MKNEKVSLRMRNKLLMVVCSLFVGSISLAQSTQETWTKKKAHQWYKKKEWLQGTGLTPHHSINEQEFARQYHANQASWDKAFLWLKEHHPDTISKGKYPIDGSNVFA